MKSIYDYTQAQMIEEFKELGEKKFRATQVFEWLYRQNVQSFEQMNNLSLDLREKLSQIYQIGPMKIETKQVSQDGTIKYLLQLEDGGFIETVLMVHDYGRSLCVTSQLGCNMGCRFCASGLLKKQRNLTAGEMVNQVLTVMQDTQERISHVVVMGTGEPFDNYTNVMNFCSIVNSDLGLAIGSRHITISTCGIVPKIREFAQGHYQYNLAISLHAPTNELRRKLMPIAKAYPLDELMQALREYSEDNHRRLTFEYILLHGVNDSDEMAITLANLVRGMNAYINLIPYNQVDENGYIGVDDKKALHFYDILMKHGVKATLRQKHGDDIDAACGQLRAKHERNKQSS